MSELTKRYLVNLVILLNNDKRIRHSNLCSAEYCEPVTAHEESQMEKVVKHTFLGKTMCYLKF